MKSRTIITLALVLMTTFTLVETAAAGDTARGKMIPDETIASPKAAGSYVLKTVEFPNLTYVSITISARKLAPNSDYRVGVIECNEEFYNNEEYWPDGCAYIFHTETTNSRGSLKSSWESTHEYSGLDWMFQAVVEPDFGTPGGDLNTGEPWALYGEEVPLFFE